MQERVIPAWAGNTIGSPYRRGRLSGHPRVGGEHRVSEEGVWSTNGSSPRGRGTLDATAADKRFERVIPAWAGNTLTIPSLGTAKTGHPRVGGEHEFWINVRCRFSGSSPRGRGTPWAKPSERQERRVIPAWAGNTRLVPKAATPSSGHPRVGGEHNCLFEERRGGHGSSPRGRGTRTASPNGC